jgi:predicted RecA/RadA family phage recombinase
MATNFKHSGKRLPVATASAEIASGAFCIQEGIFGIALGKILSGGSGTLAVTGVWDVALNNVSKGDAIFVASLADAVAATITKTASSNFFVGTAVGDHDATTNIFPMLLGPQGPRAEPA